MVGEPYPSFSELAVPVTVAARADLAGLVSDAGWAPWDVASRLTARATEVTEADPDLSRYFHLMAFVARLFVRRGRDGEFVTLNHSVSEQGIGIRDMSAAHLDLLKASITPKLAANFRARLLDILWLRRHGDRQSMVELGGQAVDAYLQDARTRQLLGGGHAVIGVFSLERALRLSFRLDRQGDGPHGRAIEAVTTLAGAYKQSGQWRCFLDAAKLIQEFRVLPPADLAGMCEEAAAKAESSSEQLNAESLWHLAVSLRRKGDDGEALAASVLGVVELSLRQADVREADSPGTAAWFIEDALKQLRELPKALRGDRETGLVLRLLGLQRRSASEMRSVSATFDGHALWEEGVACVAGRPFDEALLALATAYQPPHYQDILAEAEEQVRESAFSHLGARDIVDRDRKPMKRILSSDTGNGLEQTRSQAVEMAAGRQCTDADLFVEAARSTLGAEHSADERDILPMMHRSLFVPPGREPLWARALSSAIAGDFALSTHLLLPQLEHAMRRCLQSCGIPPVTVKPSGEQEDWDLNRMLHPTDAGAAPAVALLGEDAAFDLRALLVHRAGPNLRNDVAHGRIEFEELDGPPSRYLFWVCLRLCLLPTTPSSP